MAFVGIGGRGYSGQLRYAGDNRLEVVGIRQVTLPPTAEELVAAAQAEAAAAVAAARADADAAVAAAEARLAAVEAESAAAIAEARTALASAQDKVDVMMAEAHRPSAVTIAPGQIDPSLLNLDAAQVYLAGPESIYVSSIGYGGDTYSALLRYRGGTNATVERIFGSSGKLIPDSVDLSHTELTLTAPDILDVAYVGVGGKGFSGKLRYAGGNRLEVVDLREVALPLTAEQLVAAADARAAAGLAEARAAVADVEARAADAIADARAAADDAVAEAEARLAAVEAKSAGAIADAQAALAGAQDKIDTMEAEAYRPSALLVSADRIDPRLLNLADARVSVAGPESIYVSGITYGDDTYSALLRYRGGTTATVDKVFGPTGKLIPDSIDLSHTELSMDGAVLDVANVGVDGRGYSGQLRHVGGNRFEVVGLTPRDLPPTPEELVAEARAAAAAEVAQAEADASAAAADVAAADAEVAKAEAEVAKAEARLAAVEAESAAAIAEARAALASAQGTVDMLMAEAYRPSVVMVSAEQIDPRLLNLDAAQASLAGPESIYVSSIRYGGDTYSALLRYRGGTTATVESIFGPTGKLIPDSVDLSSTELSLIEPDVVDVAYVGVGRTGYSGQLRYAGDNRLEVVGIRPVALPPTADQLVAAANARAAAGIGEVRAAADASIAAARATADSAVAEARAEADAAAAAVAAAEADAAAARAEIEALRLELAPVGRVIIPGDLDMRRLSLDSATVSIAGPDSIYVSGIGYGMKEYAVRLQHTSANEGVAEKLYDSADRLMPALDLSAPAIEAVARDTLVISNVGIGGEAYAVSFRARSDGVIVITPSNQGHRVRTAGELRRDQLLADSAAAWLVSGFDDGAALPNEGSWTAGEGWVSQTDAEATHAKFAMAMAQPDAATLYGITASTQAGARTGYGLHFLASATPRSGNTWNYGQSYLIWITQEEGFYDTDHAHVQLYQSLDSGRLLWLNSTKIARSLSSQLTLEALYQPGRLPGHDERHLLPRLDCGVRRRRRAVQGCGHRRGGRAHG